MEFQSHPQERVVISRRTAKDLLEATRCNQMGQVWRRKHSFFHANATIRYRKNLIASLESDSGEVLQAHKDKENLI